MSMPLFGAIEEFSEHVDQGYNLMNRKQLLNLRKVRTWFCTGSCTIAPQGLRAMFGEN
jgi:hypothetical protein